MTRTGKVDADLSARTAFSSMHKSVRSRLAAWDVNTGIIVAVGSTLLVLRSTFGNEEVDPAE